MVKKSLVITILAITVIILTFGSSSSHVEACGGLFCQNSQVNQQAENIVFTVNNDGTISAIVQINFTGSSPDFSWVVPVPSIPEVDVTDMLLFEELQAMTAPVIIPPPRPNCISVVPTGTATALPTASPTSTVSPDLVEVLASGEAGPYEFDVITSPEYGAMITWLNMNNYRVTPQMEPLIKVYSDEGMIFLAMKLQPDAGAQDIAPIKMTYELTKPMIPLRLTAVAANANMRVTTWIFADEQAYPTNYAHPTIANENIRFNLDSRRHNYNSLMTQTVSLYSGRAFVTEMAAPSAELDQRFIIQDEDLQLIVENYKYMTRFYGQLSPFQMTVDPMFDFDGDLTDFDNVRDLTHMDAEVVWNCVIAPIDIQYDELVVPENFQ